MATAKTSGKRTAPRKSTGNVWSDAERAAMQASARERKSQAGRSPADERAEGEREVRERIAGMPQPDRAMGEQIHQLVSTSAPALVPRTYYGMPAWARDGKTICFFKPASKFKVRYATFEFQPDASLDDGEMWPVSFAVMELTDEVKERIVELVKKAAG